MYTVMTRCLGWLFYCENIPLLQPLLRITKNPARQLNLDEQLFVLFTVLSEQEIQFLFLFLDAFD